MKSIVKDYLTGKEYVEIKHKPDLPIKGRASVYLYNARTGKLELEAHTPNIIYPEVYTWLRSYQWDKFCSGAPNKTNSYSGYWEMDRIFLVTSSKPENERVDLLTYDESGSSNGNPGQQIGWADKTTYSGSDTQRGTPNTVESYANNSRVHWVFDWPTHAANGTFQTIIWGNKIAPYLDNIFTKNIGFSTDVMAGVDLTTDGTYLYTLTYNGLLYKISSDGTVLGYVDTGIRSYQYSSIGLEFKNSYFYALEYDGKLHEISANGEVLNTRNIGISTNSKTGFGIASDGTYFYVLSYEKVLYKLTSDGTILNSYNLSEKIEGTSDCGFSLTYVSPHLYVLSPFYYVYKITSTGDVLGKVNTGMNASWGSVGLTSIGLYLYELFSNGTLYKWYLNDHYLARTRLAAPVTKTNQQTLKVQYDFIYEE